LYWKIIVPRGTVGDFMFDVLVIGGGHAGIEAAYIASQFNIKVAVVTLPEIGLGSAPCNPSVGGVGKGQVVRELDALGGLMGILADKAGIQYRTLNDSKGFAVQSTRVQIDKDKYSYYAEELFASLENVQIIREKVVSTDVAEGDFIVHTTDRSYRTKKIIVTVGTFLNGKMHTGCNQTSGGRVGCEASPGLGSLFSSIKTRNLRFKTGTPPRIDKKSIDFQLMEEQPSDSSVRNFHCMNDPFSRNLKQVSCYLTYTNQETMESIRANKEKSPMFNGQIKGVGARYCPSIEDKAYRYPDKNIHHVFIEPEGIDSELYYPSGISSSLPKEVQEQYVQSIKGLNNAKISVYGYAVEYDVVDTTDLFQTLEHKSIPGLYFAGQVNGTSGYEEAAGQGYIAGVNASLSVLGRESFVLSRHDSYIGVMIEDLVSNMRDEPYRLFTARSENRLHIREDNTLLRMYPYRKSLELTHNIDKFLENFVKEYSFLMDLCDEVSFSSSSDDFLKCFGDMDVSDLSGRYFVSELLRQAKLDPVKIMESVTRYSSLEISYDLLRVVAISKKYEGYIARADQQLSKIKKLDSMKISWQDIVNSSNISYECRLRVERIRPETFGQLKLIEGIRPATLAVVAAKAL